MPAVLSLSAASLALQRPSACRSAIFTSKRGLHRLGRPYWRLHASEEPQSTATPAEQAGGPAAAAAEDDGDSLFEQQVLAKRRKPKAKRQQQQGPVVISAARDQVYGAKPLTFEQRAENTVVVTLGVVFTAILAEGIFLAAAGFMSEGADRFASDVVYPAFSPTVGLFLLLSSAYGLWKTKFQGAGKLREEEKQ